MSDNLKRVSLAKLGLTNEVEGLGVRSTHTVALSKREVRRPYPLDSNVNYLTYNFLTTESLILAQDERWRCASYMQVERETLAC